MDAPVSGDTGWETLDFDDTSRNDQFAGLIRRIGENKTRQRIGVAGFYLVAGERFGRDMRLPALAVTVRSPRARARRARRD